MRSNIVLAALFAFCVLRLVLCVGMPLFGFVSNTKQQFCFDFSINMALTRVRVSSSMSLFIRIFPMSLWVIFFFSFLESLRFSSQCVVCGTHGSYCGFSSKFFINFTILSFFTLLVHHKPVTRINTCCGCGYSFTTITNRIGMILSAYWLIVSMLVIITGRTIDSQISFRLPNDEFILLYCHFDSNGKRLTNYLHIHLSTGITASRIPVIMHQTHFHMYRAKIRCIRASRIFII